jgi:CRP-like cAMP-binding protein
VTLLAGDNNNVLIPNGQVARSKITNYHTPTRETARSISIGLEYSLPPHEARRVLLLAAHETPGIAATPAASVSLASYDASAVTYKLVFWIDKPSDHGTIEAAVRWNVWYRLQQAGLSVPFDTKTVAMSDPAKEARERASLGREERLAAIKKSTLFGTLSPERQELLAAKSRDFYLAAGQVFYRQGEPGIALYLVLSGTAHAVFQTDDSRVIDLGDTAIGGVFGETSAMTGHARTATVMAKTDVRAAEIRREHLHELLAADPSLAKHMSEVVAQSQARREEVMRALGATHVEHEETTHSQGVLDRMRKLFNLIHR